MADVDDVLLLWFDILGLCLPSLFLVSPLLKISFSPFKDNDTNHIVFIYFASHITACATAACSKSPHSRTVKRTTSGSSSSHLSCSWYGFPSSTPFPPHRPFHLISPTFWLFSIPQGLSPLFNLPFLSSPLAYVPIYFWSRRHPSTPISLFGLLTITAPYLPFALVAFSWVLTGTWRAAASDLVGCAVGHVGWFIRDVWTREMVGGPTILSEAPEPL